MNYKLHSFSIFLILFSLCGSALAQSSLPAYVPTDGLVGYYPFDGDGRDLSPLHNDGTLVMHPSASNLPTPASDRHGNPSGALRFGGYYNPNAVQIPRYGHFDSLISVSFWFSTHSFGSMDSDPNGSYTEQNPAYNVINFGGDGYDGGNSGHRCPSGLRFQAMFDTDGDGSLIVFCRNTVDQQSDERFSNYAIFPCPHLEEWIHVVYTIDHHILRCYFDGRLYMEDSTVSVDMRSVNFYDLFVGYMFDPANGNEYFPFDGRIDEVGVWNRVLDDDEVAALYGGYLDPLASRPPQKVSVSVQNICNSLYGVIKADPNHISDATQFALDDPEYMGTTREWHVGPGWHRVSASNGCAMWDTIVWVDCECPRETTFHDTVCPGQSHIPRYGTLFFDGGENGSDRPAGWSFSDGSGNPGFQSNIYIYDDVSGQYFMPYTGNYAWMEPNYVSRSTSTMTLPPIHIKNPATAKLSFWFLMPAYYDYYYQYADDLFIHWSTSPTNFPNTQRIFAEDNDVPSWRKVVIPLSALPGENDYYFRFTHNNWNAWFLMIDDILVEGEFLDTVPQAVFSAAVGSTVTTQKYYVAASGCDSVVNTVWHVFPSSSQSYSQQVCSNAQFFWPANGPFGHGTNLNYGKSGAQNSRTVTGPTYQLPGFCESADTLRLSFNNIVYGQRVAKDTCASQYSWGGQTYTSNGSYRHYVFTDSSACSRPDTLVLRLFSDVAAPILVDTLRGSYSWRGNTYTSSGHFFDTAFHAARGGCDSLFHLHLVEAPPAVLGASFSVDTCASIYFWRSNSYTASGTYTQPNPSTGAVDTLHLRLLHDVVYNQSAFCCRHYLWRGRNLSEPGPYTDTAHLAVDGLCDSIFILNLAHQEDNILVQHRDACDSFEWYGQVFRSSTNTVQVQDDGDCRTYDSLYLTIRTSPHTDSFLTICDSAVWWDGFLRSASGNYDMRAISDFGCDSITTLHLSVFFPEEAPQQDEQFCHSFLWRGRSYSIPATYRDTVHNAVGGICDSIYVLRLYQSPDPQTFDTATSCTPFLWRGNTMVVSTDTSFIETSEDCNIVHNLHFTRFFPLDADSTVKSCEKYRWYGSIFTSDTLAHHTLTDVNGCLATRSLHLTLYHTAFASTENHLLCGPFSWRGYDLTPENYLQFVDPATHTLSDTVKLAVRFLCDSIYSIALSAGDIFRQSDTVSACNTFSWRGRTFSSSQDATDTIHSSVACDSILSLHLSLHFDSPVSDTFASVCNRFDWYEHANISASSDTLSHRLLNRFGCDSILRLKLTVNYNSDTTYMPILACEKFHLSTIDSTYSASTLISHTETNRFGCDSVMTLDLTIAHRTTEVYRVSGCHAYSWPRTGKIYTVEGTYFDTLSAHGVGCDTIIELQVSLFENTVINATPDTAIHQCSSATLRASGADFYFWEDPVSGDTIYDSVLTVSPSRTTTYTVHAYSMSPSNMVFNGDLEDGWNGFSTELVKRPAPAQYGWCAITDHPEQYYPSFSGSDHTSGSGKMLIVDGATSRCVHLQQTFAVQPHTYYCFSFWCTVVLVGGPPRLQLFFNGEPAGPEFAIADATFNWRKYQFLWYSGENSMLTVQLFDNNLNPNFNDYALDDIGCYPLLCEATKTVTVSVISDTVEASYCHEYLWSEAGISFNSPGFYPHAIPSVSGCDSLVTLHLSHAPIHYDTVDQYACRRYYWPLTDITYAASGLYNFTITHPEHSSVARCDTARTLNLHIENCPFPDNVEYPTCTTNPPANAFEMTELFHAEGVNSMSTPMVGDVDGDGIPEIVVAQNVNISPWYGNAFLVFDGRSGLQKYQFSTAQHTLCGQSMSLADVDRDGRAEFFLLDDNGFVHSYDATGQGQRWVSSDRVDAHYILMTADINGDGIGEVVVGPYIFNAQTGTLLLQGSQVPSARGYAAPHGNNGSNVQGYYMQQIADIDFDGDQEILVGNTIYKPLINNPNGTAGNSWSILRQANANPAILKYDGQTFLADFDNDGDLDVCVCGYSPYAPYSLYFYVWDGQTPDIIAFTSFPLNAYGGNGVPSTSIPFAGDLDGNGTPEVIFNNIDGMRAFTFDPSVSNASTFHIRLMHFNTTFAETAGFTVFDFNQDGANEIVYRNTNLMYIVDGRSMAYLCPPVTTFSGTICEYPIVADVNADGHAEIIVNRASNPWNGNNPYGYVSVYGSAQSAAWGSARKVWNQWVYNAVNINEDLSLPQRPFDIASRFPNGSEPFNGFLRQMPIIDSNGNQFITAADLITVNSSHQYERDTLRLHLGFCNFGNRTVDTPYFLTVYYDHYRADTLCTAQLPRPIPVGSCDSVDVTIAQDVLCLRRPDSIIVTLNDRGLGIGQHGNMQSECDTLNNRFDFPFQLPPNEGLQVVTHSCDSFRWLDTTFRLSPPARKMNIVRLDSFLNRNHCDSIVSLNLWISASFDSTLRKEVCDSFFWPITNTFYALSQNVDVPMHTPAGCDSSYHLLLTTHPSYHFLEGDTVGEYFLPFSHREHTFTDAAHGFPFEYHTQFGCDSVYIYTLHVLPTPHICEKELGFPNLVTPNGDGYNDIFRIVGLVENNCYPHNHLIIYNRWGGIVFSQKNIASDKDFWDPINMPSGTYFFHFRGSGTQGDIERQGTIEVMK